MPVAIVLTCLWSVGVQYFMKIAFKNSLKKLERFIYSFEFPRIQCFSIPPNIIYYINQNPVSPNGLQKLQQTCKWFFGKNQIIVIHNGLFEDEKLMTDKYKGKLQNSKAKFWFNGYLKIYYVEINKFLSLKQHAYNITKLVLTCLRLTHAEYNVLISSLILESLSIDYCIILDEAGNNLSLDILLQNLCNLSSFECFKSKNTAIITNKTLKIISELMNKNKCKNFILGGFTVAADVDPKLFALFLFNAASPNASFRFYLVYSFGEEQRKYFDDSVQAMLEEWDCIYQKPNIHFCNTL